MKVKSSNEVNKSSVICFEIVQVRYTGDDNDENSNASNLIVVWLSIKTTMFSYLMNIGRG